MSTTCKATRKNGQPCQAPAGDDGLCFGHSPRYADARRAGSKRGGRHKRTDHRADKLLPEIMRPVFFSVLQDMAGVKNGTMDPRRGSAVASLANAAVRIYEMGLLEQRVRDLETRSDDHQKGWVS